MGRPRKVQLEETNTEVEVEVVDRPSKLNRADRPKRVPINGFRDILTVEGQEDGWHYCWVNEDRLDRYLAAYYEYVTHEVVVGATKINSASQMGEKVVKAVGNGVTAYLMRIPQEYFVEDMDSLHGLVDEQEMAMRSQLNSKQDGQYGEVKIEQSKPLAVRRSVHSR